MQVVIRKYQILDWQSFTRRTIQMLRLEQEEEEEEICK